MEKEFVPHSLAVKLKVLGFDWPCYAYIYTGDTGNNYDHYIEVKPSDAKDWNDKSDLCISRPLYQQAFRWFREKNFHVNIDSYHCLGKAKPFGLSIDYLHKSGKWDYIDYRDDADFETYEEAQKRAIEVIIEILENE